MSGKPGSETAKSPASERSEEESGQPSPQVETEIYITPDGQVLITDLTPDLLALAQSLAPDDPRLARLRQLLAEKQAAPPEPETQP